MEEYLYPLVDNINSVGSRHSYEIVVISQKKPTRDNVVWISEDGRRGPIWGFNYASQTRESKYCIFITDDHAFKNSFSDGIDFIENNFKEKEFPISSLNINSSHNPMRGETLGYSAIDFYIERYTLCKFPIFERERALKALGGFIFHPSLFYHAADIVLGHYMARKGQPCDNSPVGISEVKVAKDSTFETLDCEIAKWKIKQYYNETFSYL